MLLSNVISLNKEVINNVSGGGQASMKAKLCINFMNWFKLGDVEASGELKSSKAKKVLETFEIKTTKSVILDDVIEK